MFTRPRLAVGAAVAGLAVAAAVAASGMIHPPTAVQAARLDSGSLGQAAQAQPAPEHRPGRHGHGSRPTPEQIQQRQQEFTTALAKHLNMSPDAVQQALDQTRADLKNARIAAVQQAVKDGKLTQDQANQIVQRIQSDQHGRGSWPGHGPGHSSGTQGS
jgi:hypothetical protein